MTIRLVAFDVDATLAGVGEAVSPEVAGRIARLEARGVRLLFNSGKSAWYLAGLARGLGVRRPLLAGENGCILFDPELLEETRLAERPPRLDEVERFVLGRFGPSVWLQPNQVALTVFPKDPGLIPAIAGAIRTFLKPHRDRLHVVAHADAIDVFPEGTDKGRAMRAVKARYGYRTEEIAAVGDSETDLPMFREAGLPLIVGDKIAFEGARKAATIIDALNLLEELIP